MAVLIWTGVSSVGSVMLGGIIALIEHAVHHETSLHHLVRNKR